MRRAFRRVMAAGLLVTTAACAGGDETPGAGAATSAAISPGPIGEDTPRLDSIAVLGHSGATGTISDPQHRDRNLTEDSWATGRNPEVHSIYRRLLVTHPALRGHAYDETVADSTADTLDDEFNRVLDKADPPPDLIVIQTIDNDMRCDGTDSENYRPFGETLDRTLTAINAALPLAYTFFVSQWATVETWTRWASRQHGPVRASTGTGPCDVFDAHGRIRPAGIASMQEIADSYWDEVERACARHHGCFTDGGALQTMQVEDRDVAGDLDHLTVAGRAEYAAIVWQALADPIKDRR